MQKYSIVIRVIIELILSYPYRKSLDILVEFDRIWDCTLLFGSCVKEKAIISMSVRNFKKIFGSNPQVGEYKVPKNTEHFTKLWKVQELRVE